MENKAHGWKSLTFPMGRRGAPGEQGYFPVDDSELLLKSGRFMVERGLKYDTALVHDLSRKRKVNPTFWFRSFLKFHHFSG